AISVVRFFSGDAVSEIGVGMQPGTAYLLDDFDEKERVFADRVVILQIDDDVFRGGMFHYPRQARRCAVQVGRRISSMRSRCTNSGCAEGHSRIHPLFAESDSLAALARVCRVWAVVAIDSDINDECACAV